MREKPTNTSVIHSIYYLLMGSPRVFGSTLLSSGSVPSAFWEMLNWEAVDRILRMGVLCLVSIQSTALQLSISQKALGTFPEDGNIMPKQVGSTIHN
jgi:hypothetical protein